MSFYASQSLRRGSSEMLPHRKWPGNTLPFFPLKDFTINMMALMAFVQMKQCLSFESVREKNLQNEKMYSF